MIVKIPTRRPGLIARAASFIVRVYEQHHWKAGIFAMLVVAAFYSLAEG